MIDFSDSQLPDNELAFYIQREKKRLEDEKEAHRKRREQMYRYRMY